MVADWVVVELEPAGAAPSGLPARLAVPREVAEAGQFLLLLVAEPAASTIISPAGRPGSARPASPAGSCPAAQRPSGVIVGLPLSPATAPNPASSATSPPSGCSSHGPPYRSAAFHDSENHFSVPVAHDLQRLEHQLP